MIGRIGLAWDFKEVRFWGCDILQSFGEFLVFLDAGHGRMTTVVSSTRHAWHFKVIGLWGTVRFSLGTKGWDRGIGVGDCEENIFRVDTDRLVHAS